VAVAFIEASNTVIFVTPNSYLNNTDTQCACADLCKSSMTRNMDTVMLLVIKYGVSWPEPIPLAVGSHLESKQSFYHSLQANAGKFSAVIGHDSYLFSHVNADLSQTLMIREMRLTFEVTVFTVVSSNRRRRWLQVTGSEDAFVSVLLCPPSPQKFL